MSQRKTYMLVDIKARKKKEKKRKGFYGRSKNISGKTNSTPVNSIPALSRRSSLNNTSQIIVATQTFDDNQTPSIS